MRAEITPAVVERSLRLARPSATDRRCDLRDPRRRGIPQCTPGRKDEGRPGLRRHRAPTCAPRAPSDRPPTRAIPSTSPVGHLVEVCRSSTVRYRRGSVPGPSPVPNGRRGRSPRRLRPPGPHRHRRLRPAGRLRRRKALPAHAVPQNGVGIPIGWNDATQAHTHRPVCFQRSKRRAPTLGYASTPSTPLGDRQATPTQASYPLMGIRWVRSLRSSRHAAGRAGASSCESLSGQAEVGTRVMVDVAVLATSRNWSSRTEPRAATNHTKP
jgi:hypothetical protein